MLHLNWEHKTITKAKTAKATDLANYVKCKSAKKD